ncbi:glycerophosphodiester phosphodiesterase 1 [Cimex lectularius]|uniref:GP-PDE domain-containing protein n=1 Tax=Cimex lectularius TaxID=79782 RepID=A0A8I6S5D2_CIMLE|nr:glycerophosphodiester phosphodiesterase 1 [Cimex lectularius]
MAWSDWSGVQVLSSCFLLWVVPFAAFLTAVEATGYLVLTVLVFGPLCSYLGIAYCSVPQPPDSVVREILGEQVQSRSPRYLPCGGSGKQDAGPSTKDVNRVIAIAHRFAGIDAPENTTTALDQCIKNGAKAVEFDVVLTGDMVPVVFHDPKLQRMTGLTEDIRKLPYAHVKELNVSVYHHFREQFPNTFIPTLNDVIKKCIDNDMRMIIDIKEDRFEIVDIILQLFSKYPVLYKRAVVSSFNPWIIFNIRKTNPDIVGALAWRPAYMSCSEYSPIDENCKVHHNTLFMYFMSRLADMAHSFFFFNFAHSILGLSAVLIYKDNITIDMIYYWSKKNVRTIAWTVNSPLEKQYMVRELGIPYVTDTMLGNADQ